MRPPTRLQNLSVPTYTPEKPQSPSRELCLSDLAYLELKAPSNSLPTTFLTPLQSCLPSFQPRPFLSHQSVCFALIIPLAILHCFLEQIIASTRHIFFCSFNQSTTMTHLLKDLAWNYLIGRKVSSDQSCIDWAELVLYYVFSVLVLFL